MDHKELWNILQDGNTRPHDLHPEKPLFRSRSKSPTGHGTMELFQIWKGVCQGCVLSTCLFNFCAVYILQNGRLDEAQAGIKIAGRNIDNLRYADGIILMAESEEELKRLLMKVKEKGEKVGLKLNISNYMQLKWTTCKKWTNS